MAASGGDKAEWAVDRLLERPVLPSDAEPCYAAFVLLSRDRGKDSISLGMAGGLQLPRPVPRDAMRREGERFGFDGDALDDFVEAVMQLDDFYIETEMKRIAAETKASAERAKRR